MLVVASARKGLLDCLPNQSVVAEIGVAVGDFSQEILIRTLPSKLHLIDPWLHQGRKDYQDDPNNVPQAEADQRYRDVCKRFGSHVEAGRVEIHRTFSGEIVSRFDDAYFDWIYIDALHTYEGCLADLRQYDQKVQPDGFICGHDYANHRTAKKMNFGVVEAVNEFVRDTGYELAFLSYEPYPTYIISKDPKSQRHHELVTETRKQHVPLVEIEAAEQRSFQHVFVTHVDGTESFHYRFS